MYRYILPPVVNDMSDLDSDYATKLYRMYEDLYEREHAGVYDNTNLGAKNKALYTPYWRNETWYFQPPSGGSHSNSSRRTTSIYASGKTSDSVDVENDIEHAVRSARARDRDIILLFFFWGFKVHINTDNRGIMRNWRIYPRDIMMKDVTINDMVGINHHYTDGRVTFNKNFKETITRSKGDVTIDALSIELYTGYDTTVTWRGRTGTSNKEVKLFCMYWLVKNWDAAVNAVDKEIIELDNQMEGTISDGEQADLIIQLLPEIDDGYISTPGINHKWTVYYDKPTHQVVSVLHKGVELPDGSFKVIDTIANVSSESVYVFPYIKFEFDGSSIASLTQMHSKMVRQKTYISNLKKVCKAAQDEMNMIINDDLYDTVDDIKSKHEMYVADYVARSADMLNEVRFRHNVNQRGYYEERRRLHKESMIRYEAELEKMRKK